MRLEHDFYVLRFIGCEHDAFHVCIKLRHFVDFNFDWNKVIFILQNQLLLFGLVDSTLVEVEFGFVNDDLWHVGPGINWDFDFLVNIFNQNLTLE